MDNEGRVSYLPMHASGDGGGIKMEIRIARLESDVEYIKRDVGDLKTDVREIRSKMRIDFRLLFGAIIATTLGLAYLMAQGFKWL